MKIIIFILLSINVRIVFRAFMISFIPNAKQTDAVKTMLASIIVCSIVTISFCIYELASDDPAQQFQFVSLITLYSVIICEVLYLIYHSTIKDRKEDIKWQS